MCWKMSSVQRFCGLPVRRLALCRGSIVGSHCKACTVHLLASSVATFRAHRHFRCLCSVVQSWMPRAVSCASASCVHRLIQSIHGSNSSSSFTASKWMSLSGKSLSTSSGFESEVSLSELESCCWGLGVGGQSLSLGVWGWSLLLSLSLSSSLSSVVVPAVVVVVVAGGGRWGWWV